MRTERLTITRTGDNMYYSKGTLWHHPTKPAVIWHYGGNQKLFDGQRHNANGASFRGVYFTAWELQNNYILNK